MATRRAGLGKAQGAAAAKAAAAVVVVEVGKALLLRRGRGEKPREERAAVVDFLRSARKKRDPIANGRQPAKKPAAGQPGGPFVAVWLVGVVGDMGGVNNGELRTLCSCVCAS